VPIGCSFCIDFAHVLARYGKHEFAMLKEGLNRKDGTVIFQVLSMEIKGEKKHIQTLEKEWEELLKELPSDKEIVIVSEAPNSMKGAVLGLSVLKKL